MENAPAVLFDALVLRDGDAGVRALAADGHTMEFVTNTYRQGKTLLAFGASSKLLDGAGISATLGSGATDEGLLLAHTITRGTAAAFISALAKHRHQARENDPSTV